MTLYVLIICSVIYIYVEGEKFDSTILKMSHSAIFQREVPFTNSKHFTQWNRGLSTFDWVVADFVTWSYPTPLITQGIIQGAQSVIVLRYRVNEVGGLS